MRTFRECKLKKPIPQSYHVTVLHTETIYVPHNIVQNIIIRPFQSCPQEVKKIIHIIRVYGHNHLYLQHFTNPVVGLRPNQDLDHRPLPETKITKKFQKTNQVQHKKFQLTLQMSKKEKIAFVLQFIKDFNKPCLTSKTVVCIHDKAFQATKSLQKTNTMLPKKGIISLFIGRELGRDVMVQIKPSRRKKNVNVGVNV